MDGSGNRPSERMWIVGPETIPDDRPLSPEELPAASDLAVALNELTPILDRLGGVVTVATERMPHPQVPGLFVNLRFVIRWHSFVPAHRGAEGQSQPEPAPQPEASGDNGNGIASAVEAATT